MLAEHEIETLVEPIEPAPAVPEEWKPQPRIQTPYKENSDPATFKVGTWERQPGGWIRLALPNPRWPEPNAIATDEIAATYDAEWSLQLEAQLTLEHYL